MRRTGTVLKATVRGVGPTPTVTYTTALGALEAECGMGPASWAVRGCACSLALAACSLALAACSYGR